MPPLSVSKIVKYCDVRGGKRGIGGGPPKSHKNNGAPIPVIKIVRYGGQKHKAYKHYNCILPVTN